MIKIGQTLAQLRKQGVLLIGTGNLIYNEDESDYEQKNLGSSDWAKETHGWFIRNLDELNIVLEPVDFPNSADGFLEDA